MGNCDRTAQDVPVPLQGAPQPQPKEDQQHDGNEREPSTGEEIGQNHQNQPDDHGKHLPRLFAINEKGQAHRSPDE